MLGQPGLHLGVDLVRGNHVRKKQTGPAGFQLPSQIHTCIAVAYDVGVAHHGKGKSRCRPGGFVHAFGIGRRGHRLRGPAALFHEALEGRLAPLRRGHGRADGRGRTPQFLRQLPNGALDVPAAVKIYDRPQERQPGQVMGYHVSQSDKLWTKVLAGLEALGLGQENQVHPACQVQQVAVGQLYRKAGLIQGVSDPLLKNGFDGWATDYYLVSKRLKKGLPIWEFRVIQKGPRKSDANRFSPSSASLCLIVCPGANRSVPQKRRTPAGVFPLRPRCRRAIYSPAFSF